MPEYILQKISGLPVFDCQLLNKHHVTLTVKALIDTSCRSSRISYRIYSALGFDDVSDLSGNQLDNSCRAWILIDLPRMKQKKLEGVFEISGFSADYDLIIGMDLISQYFDIQIFPSRGVFQINFFNS